MKKLKSYIAISLNGKIARPNGDVDWLDAIPNPDKLDYGYFAFYDSIDTTIQGSKTYEKVKSWDIPFPYPEKKNYVITRQQDLSDTEHVTFVKNNHIDFIKSLKKEEGKDIWLIGGGLINTMCFNENLIDEMYIHIIPIIIPEGIGLFGSIPIESQMKLLDSKTYSTGVVELRYTAI